jgi:hypothetical protein
MAHTTPNLRSRGNKYMEKREATRRYYKNIKPWYGYWSEVQRLQPGRTGCLKVSKIFQDCELDQALH